MTRDDRTGFKGGPGRRRRGDLLREYFLNAVTLAVLKESGSDLEKKGVREEFMRLIREAHRLPPRIGPS